MMTRMLNLEVSAGNEVFKKILINLIDRKMILKIHLDMRSVAQCALNPESGRSSELSNVKFNMSKIYLTGTQPTMILSTSIQIQEDMTNITDSCIFKVGIK